MELSLATKTGGLSLVHQQHTEFLRKMRAHKKSRDTVVSPSKALRQSSALYQRISKKKNQIKKLAPPPIVWNHFCPDDDIHYNHKTDNEKMEIMVGGGKRQFFFNTTTQKTQNRKPRPQATEMVLSNMHQKYVSSRTGEVVKIIFPRDSPEEEPVECFVIYASRESQCHAAKALHNVCMGDRGGGNDWEEESLDALIDNLPRTAWEDDHRGGGCYTPFGFGIQGHPKDIPEPGMPFTLRTMKYKQSHKILEKTAKIFYNVASCIAKHCTENFLANQKIKDLNPQLACPPLKQQNSFCNWFCSQFIFRRLGPGRQRPRKTRDETIVSLHFDSGDYATDQPLIYIPGGGKDGLGGTISDSDIIVCKYRSGGPSVRIVTNVRDTVVVVLLNSSLQLHGVIKGKGRNDYNAWCTRIIPFVQHLVYKWMKKNPRKSPFDTFQNYF